MEKKYQVFISSTYKDLVEERQKVIEALLGKNCFPVGMEYFPAANDDQFTVIKKLIDRCDYYILIIGGRYGSIEPKSEKSYTQLEFEYALSKDIPITCFYHADPINIVGTKTESTDAGKRKLEEFKKIVQTKLCDTWKEPYELAFKVIKSLDHLFENNPRTGWVKADEISSAEANKELLKLREENAELNSQIKFLSLKTPDGTEVYKQGEDMFTIHFIEFCEEREVSEKECSWNQIFLSVSTALLKPTTENEIIELIEKGLLEEFESVNRGDIQTILIQLMALKLIKAATLKSDNLCTYWMLTPYGIEEMVKLKAVKK